MLCSPFGGIPRNWKQSMWKKFENYLIVVPPSGGSLEIGNLKLDEVTIREALRFPLRGDP